METIYKRISYFYLIIMLLVLSFPTKIFAENYVEDIIWQQNESDASGISWNSNYRFCTEGYSTGEEIAIISDDKWSSMKEGTFYLFLKATNGWDNLNIRITTGWWSVTYGGNDHNCKDDSEFITDMGNGYYILEITLSNNTDLCELLDVQHLLFTGDAYIPLKIYFRSEVSTPEYNVETEAQSELGFIDVKNSNDEALTKAGKGEIVYLEAKPQEGYIFDSWELTKGSMNIEALKNKNPITLRMPEENIGFKANFVKAYNINLSVNENGKAFSLIGESFKKCAKPGETVQLCVAANDGYVFSKWEANGLEIKNNVFVMPEKDVTIKAIFDVPSKNQQSSSEKHDTAETKFSIPKTGIR